jgi:prophage regulatory protein
MADYSDLVRKPWERGITPFRRATTYQRPKDGTHPPAMKIGRMSAWVAGELAAVNRAITMGRSDDQIRQLVADLVAQRRSGEGE